MLYAGLRYLITVCKRRPSFVLSFAHSIFSGFAVAGNIYPLRISYTDILEHVFALYDLIHRLKMD